MTGRVAQVTARVVSPDGASEQIALGRVYRDGSTYLPREVEARFINTRREVAHIQVELTTWGPEWPQGFTSKACYSPPLWARLNQLAQEGGSLVRDLLMPQLPATYLPQAWVNDYATEVDGKFTFDALPALCRWKFSQFLNAIKGHGEKWDRLADGQPGAQAHNGPFEVDPDLDHLTGLLQVFWGDEELELDEMVDSAFNSARWDDFRKRAAAIRQPLQRRLVDQPMHLGHGFLLDRRPSPAAAASVMREALQALQAYLEKQSAPEDRALAQYVSSSMTRDAAGAMQPEIMLHLLDTLLPRLEALSQPGDRWPALCARSAITQATDAVWSRSTGSSSAPQVLTLSTSSGSGGLGQLHSARVVIDDGGSQLVVEVAGSPSLTDLLRQALPAADRQLEEFLVGSISREAPEPPARGSAFREGRGG